VAGYDLSDTVELFHRVNEQEIIGRWYYRWYQESTGLTELGEL
jgi:hypothetical protein